MTVWYGITWALTECVLTETLVWACLQIAEWAKTKCSVYSLAHAQECVLQSTCPRACTSQYTPVGLYWLIQALGHVLLNTQSWVSSLRKTESVLENTLGKVRGTWKVKITFKNWIMYCTAQPELVRSVAIPSGQKQLFVQLNFPFL